MAKCEIEALELEAQLTQLSLKSNHLTKDRTVRIEPAEDGGPTPWETATHMPILTMPMASQMATPAMALAPGGGLMATGAGAGEGVHLTLAADLLAPFVGKKVSGHLNDSLLMKGRYVS